MLTWKFNVSFKRLLRQFQAPALLLWHFLFCSESHVNDKQETGSWGPRKFLAPRSKRVGILFVFQAVIVPCISKEFRVSAFYIVFLCVIFPLFYAFCPVWFVFDSFLFHHLPVLKITHCHSFITFWNGVQLVTFLDGLHYFFFV